MKLLLKYEAMMKLNYSLPINLIFTVQILQNLIIGFFNLNPADIMGQTILPCGALSCAVWGVEHLVVSTH
jgi:hypothetical protein